MADARRYDSTRRQEQAGRTREEILAAARALFMTDGYHDTKMTAVAAKAGVSVDTIYKAFQNKPGVLQALLRASLRGDDDAAPFEQSAAIQGVIAEPDPRRKLELYGALLAEVQPRLAPLNGLMREAAGADEQLAGLLTEHNDNRLDAMGRFAEQLVATSAVREHLGAHEVRDILWTFNSSELYDLLVVARGWSNQDYGSWIADTLVRALLRDDYAKR